MIEDRPALGAKMLDKFDFYSVGHSVLSYESFFLLIQKWGVTAVADVRSSPFSRRFPHFNQSALKSGLKNDGVAYVFLGKELGGRPESRKFFCEGVADYEAMALRKEFKQGIGRILKGRDAGYRIALMCSEHNPLDCHRCLLVSRALKSEGASIGHILNNGDIKSHSDVEGDLMSMANLPSDDMLSSVEDKLSIAYRARAKKVAYSDSGQIHPEAAE